MVVRIWHKHESMNPSCLVSTFQADGCDVMVWGIFSLHTLDPLVPTEHCLNATAYPNILDNSMLPTWGNSGKSLELAPSSSNMTVHQCTKQGP
uniref:Uncharacterized protein n=1 Tax=Leptobrachium leishanense TaxID=445787 RepID=A0A8C5Q8B1_9ANUR